MVCTIPYYFLVPFFLCWGSFLNVLAYRLIQGQSITKPRSSCPKCKHIISWYDNIPVLSWLLLQGTCRNCKQHISFLYQCIEILTAIILSLLYLYLPHHHFFAYFIFFSALIVTIRSDLETMLISRFMTVYLVPVGFFMSAYALLPISLPDSILGSLFGYSFLWIINRIFKYFRGIDGIGEGDFDLLLFIGSFTGILGGWFSITIGSILGCIYGIAILFLRQQNNVQSLQIIKIPFGPFLACGAIIFVFTFQFFLA